MIIFGFSKTSDHVRCFTDTTGNQNLNIMANIDIENDKGNEKNRPADIDIEKKKSGSVWPWILGLAIVIVGAWILIELLGNGDDTDESLVVDTQEQVEEGVIERENPMADDRATTDANNPIVAYTAFLSEYKATEAMGLDHGFTSEAIERLGASLKAVATRMEVEETPEVEKATAIMDRYARDIRQDPLKASHADSINVVLMAATDVINAMQDAQFPELNSKVETLRDISKGFNGGELTLNQKGELKRYFNISQEVLARMYRESDEV